MNGKATIKKRANLTGASEPKNAFGIKKGIAIALAATTIFVASLGVANTNNKINTTNFNLPNETQYSQIVNNLSAQDYYASASDTLAIKSGSIANDVINSSPKMDKLIVPPSGTVEVMIDNSFSEIQKERITKAVNLIDEIFAIINKNYKFKIVESTNKSSGTIKIIADNNLTGTGTAKPEYESNKNIYNFNNIISGTIKLDVEDNSYNSGKGLTRTTLHEFLHILGFGDAYIYNNSITKNTSTIMDYAEKITANDLKILLAKYYSGDKKNTYEQLSVINKCLMLIENVDYATEIMLNEKAIKDFIFIKYNINIDKQKVSVKDLIENEFYVTTGDKYYSGKTINALINGKSVLITAQNYSSDLLRFANGEIKQKIIYCSGAEKIMLVNYDSFNNYVVLDNFILFDKYVGFVCDNNLIVVDATKFDINNLNSSINVYDLITEQQYLQTSDDFNVIIKKIKAKEINVEDIQKFGIESVIENALKNKQMQLEKTSTKEQQYEKIFFSTKNYLKDLDEAFTK